MFIHELKANAIVEGPLFKEPVQVSIAIPMGDSIKLIGKGLSTGTFYDPVLTCEQVSTLISTPEKEPFDGDPFKFKLGIEAMRLGLAYEYDPFFTLSIANIHPLPHQLEAVYDYFMKLARIRFLLADDPGAGKTIMAGLLIKELKIRGLINRILIITPANLTFQWRRELQEKFRESFSIINSDILRSTYGANPWQENNQVITSISWVSIIKDAKESLLRSHWDLVIVDEAHKMSASKKIKTYAYQLGEDLSQRTDHYLLMTATPHKGDPKNFCLFLELLDKDIYGDVKSLEEAMEKREAPFYLRRVKEALVKFPDPETGQVLALFTKRNVETIGFQLNNDEMDFYDALTIYVEDQSIKASVDNSARGRAIGFTMAMLQRRFASSTYAVRRSLERMKEKRELILKDPDKYRRDQITRKLPEDFDDLPEDEQIKIMAHLEDVVASYDPFELKEEIIQLGKLIDHARALEHNEIESKLVKLKTVITDKGLFEDQKMKLLIFTEHKDTLDYLVEKLRSWNLSVTQIHGGMKIGDRNTPQSRIYAEREFKEDCQIMVATEAAGEGINLQFCWFMINYDIPWNPVRLEQRMGRIHRYGQEKDCLIFNFVSVNTREGRVLHKLFERIKNIEHDLDPKLTGKVFNVLGDIFQSNQLEKMVRDMYAHNLMTEELITARIIKDVDIERFRSITHSTLEGLAKRELNLAAIIGKQEEAKEKRLIPEVIEKFFIKASPLIGINHKEIKSNQHIYTIGRIPRSLWPVGERLERLYGKLGKEYKRIVFDKEILKQDATLEWVTPGHPLFESVREAILEMVQNDLQQGAMFYNLHIDKPLRLDAYTASVKDGRGNVLHKRIFVMQVEMDGTITVRQPTIFIDLIPVDKDEIIPDDSKLPSVDKVEQTLYIEALVPFLNEIVEQRKKEIETIARHLDISLTELIHRQNLRMGDLSDKQAAGDNDPLILANIKQVEDRIDELNIRLEKRKEELERERNCTIADIRCHGRAWVIPHPQKNVPPMADMVRDEEIERIAIEEVTRYETERGWTVKSVEKENRGFDLISRKPHPEDPATSIEVRFIEVKGRAKVGDISLTSNEYRTAERLKKDYWLYVVYNCAGKPEIKIHRDPVTLGWIPVVKVEHYQIKANKIL